MAREIPQIYGTNSRSAFDESFSPMGILVSMYYMNKKFKRTVEEASKRTRRDKKEARKIVPENLARMGITERVK